MKEGTELDLLCSFSHISMCDPGEQISSAEHLLNTVIACRAAMLSLKLIYTLPLATEIA
jgi:hypothetical protein